MDFPLGSLGVQIKAHWQKYRPQMSAQLKSQGKLEESVYAAQEMTNDLMDSLLEKGLSHEQAWELAREEWAFLPSEKDEPSLPFEPATLSEQMSSQSRSALPGRPANESPDQEPTTTASPSETPSARALPGRRPAAT